MPLSIARANIGHAPSDSGLASSGHALPDLGLADGRFLTAFRARLRAQSAPASLRERVAALLREHAPEIAAEQDA